MSPLIPPCGRNGRVPDPLPGDDSEDDDPDAAPDVPVLPELLVCATAAMLNESVAAATVIKKVERMSCLPYCAPRPTSRNPARKITRERILGCGADDNIGPAIIR